MNFLESLILLLITVGLTGFLAPLLIQRIDARRIREQKIFEATLVRQSKIIDAQVKLIEDLSTLFWEYQLLLIAIPYYRQFKNRDLYQPALFAYEEKAGPLLGKIRAEISKALRLTPSPVFQELNQLYYEQLLPLDLQVSHLAAKDIAGKESESEWGKLHRFAVEDLAEIVDNTLDNLAKELNLKAYSDIINL